MVYALRHRVLLLYIHSVQRIAYSQYHTEVGITDMQSLTRINVVACNQWFDKERGMAMAFYQLGVMAIEDLFLTQVGSKGTRSVVSCTRTHFM